MKKQKISSVSAVILAGGKSSRMGQDKSQMIFGNKESMCEHLYEKLSEIFENIYVSSKEDKFSFLEKNKLILDHNSLHSPMIALDTIFSFLNESKLFIISVDMPLISLDIIEKLIDESLKVDNDITIATDEMKNKHYLCAVFDKQCKSRIKECLNQNIHKVGYLTKMCKLKEIYFNNTVKFLNLNTVEQYELALKYDKTIR